MEVLNELNGRLQASELRADIKAGWKISMS